VAPLNLAKVPVWGTVYGGLLYSKADVCAAYLASLKSPAASIKRKEVLSFRYTPNGGDHRK